MNDQDLKRVSAAWTKASEVETGMPEYEKHGWAVSQVLNWKSQGRADLDRRWSAREALRSPLPPGEG
jgi:hypothetical protein